MKRKRIAAAASIVFLAAGCGSSGKPPAVAQLGTTPTTARGTGSSGKRADFLAATLAFAKCMRTHGVPGFPDPATTGGGIRIQGDPSNPAFRTAMTHCRTLLPGGGPPAPGSSTHPSPEALAQARKSAQCMRHHGVPAFPDPTTTVPTASPAVGTVSIRNGVVFVFPQSLDTSSPAFTSAAATCGFRDHGG
jgi:hypothetical protein